MKTVKTQFKYADSTTRLYAFDCDDSLAAGVKDKVIAINTSLAGGTDDGLSTFFVSDAGNNFVQISGATIESVYSEPVDIAPEDNS